MFPINPSKVPEDSTSQVMRSSPGTASLPTPCRRATGPPAPCRGAAGRTACIRTGAAAALLTSSSKHPGPGGFFMYGEEHTAGTLRSTRPGASMPLQGLHTAIGAPRIPCRMVLLWTSPEKFTETLI